MAIELRFSKTDNTPWGFRVAGGSEYDVPLTVIKVAEGSIAENAGMQAGDVIVRINDVPTTGLTHNQAHDAILAGGTDFILAVQRGDLSALPANLLLYETSVENEVQSNSNVEESKEIPGVEDVRDPDLNITDEEIVNIIGEPQKSEIIETPVAAQSDVLKAVAQEDVEKATEKRKWSTFLQKPKNPKPKPKHVEIQAPKAPPYKVIIKKQPKKNLETPEENTLTSNTNELTDESNSIQPVTQETENIVDGDENKEQLDENDNVEDFEDDNPNEQNDVQVPEENEEEIEERPDYQEESRRQSEKRNVSLTLEEQLAQVQKQLLALSQLPSEIQQTLNAVTNQLSQIVTAHNLEEQTIEASVRVEEEITEEIIEEDVSTEVYEERALSTLEEEDTYEAELYEVEQRNLHYEGRTVEESEEEQATYEALERECERGAVSNILTEEELEAQREEQERLEKKEKDLLDRENRRRSSHPLTPLERPIILPGGRKWAQPDDAVSKIRRPSMTDEKIANTINTYSEVIVGHTMGINFLKYQPPPKNLDHLQRSAVYKLVHDIEPPARGIIARETKVLAEQDYYSQKEESDGKLPPQMER